MQEQPKTSTEAPPTPPLHAEVDKLKINIPTSPSVQPTPNNSRVSTPTDSVVVRATSKPEPHPPATLFIFPSLAQTNTSQIIKTPQQQHQALKSIQQTPQQIVVTKTEKQCQQVLVQPIVTQRNNMAISSQTQQYIQQQQQIILTPNNKQPLQNVSLQMVQQQLQQQQFQQLQQQQFQLQQQQMQTLPFIKPLVQQAVLQSDSKTQASQYQNPAQQIIQQQQQQHPKVIQNVVQMQQHAAQTAPQNVIQAQSQQNNQNAMLQKQAAFHSAGILQPQKEADSGKFVSSLYIYIYIIYYI